MAALQYILAFLSVGAIAAAIYVYMAIILPRLKDFSGFIIKDEKANEGLIFLIFTFVVVLGLSKAVKELVKLNDDYLNVISIFNSGLEVFTDSVYYVAFLVMLLVGAMALSNSSLFKKK